MHACTTRFVPRSALLLAFAVAGAAQAQDRDRDRDRDREEGVSIDTTFAFAANGSVDLTLVSGRITVTGWNRNEARVRAYVERGELRRELTRSRVALEVRRRRGRTGESRYELSVPAGTRVFARTASGDIAVRGVQGDVELHTTSGELEAASLGGRASLEAVSGGVSVSGVRGDLDIEAVSGDVDVRDAAGEVVVETVSGRVRLRALRSRWVRVESVSGEVEFEGTLDPAGRYDFDVHSGDVRLAVPGDASAQVSIETFSGTIDSDFPMTLEPGGRRRDRERRMDLTLGRGGARVRVETFSGAVTLVRVGAR